MACSNIRRQLGLFAFLYLVVQGWHLCLNSFGALAQGPEAFAPPFGPKYATEWGWVVAHGLSACLVLLLGPPLLLRRQLPGLRGGHALLGKAYLGLALFAGLTSIPMCCRAEGGALGQAGFLVLCGLWLVTVWPAYAHARRRRWREHERWIRVHYALTCAAVGIRLLLGIGARFDWDNAAWVPWLSLLPAAVTYSVNRAPWPPLRPASSRCPETAGAA